MDWSLLGLAGMAMVVLAWIPQTIETVRRRHSGLSWQFDVLYVAGALALTYYSISVNDLVFTLLNSMAAYMAAIGLYYKIAEVMKAGKRKTGKGKKKRR